MKIVFSKSQERKVEGAKTRKQVVINPLVKIHASENIRAQIGVNFSRKNSSLKQVLNTSCIHIHIIS